MSLVIQFYSCFIFVTEHTMDENTIEGRADPEGTDILVYDRPNMKNSK